MRKVVGLIIFIFVVIIGIYIVKSFKINSITCASQFTKCNNDILNSLGDVEKGKIFTTKREIVKKLDANPLVKKYTFQLKLSGVYAVRAEERVPKYCIKKGNAFYITDSEGLVFKIDESGNSKCVEEDVNYQLGDKLSDKDYFVQKVFYSIKNIAGLGKAYVASDNLIVEYNGNIKLIFPTEGDSGLLAGKAYYTVSQFGNIEKYIMEIGELTLSEVDFRFKNPVVRMI